MAVLIDKRVQEFIGNLTARFADTKKSLTVKDWAMSDKSITLRQSVESNLLKVLRLRYYQRACIWREVWLNEERLRYHWFGRSIA